MHRTYRAYPPPSPPSQQNKVILQREYREKEGVCFNTLRDVIKDLTGQELRTRQEILRKAIDLLSAASKIKRQSEAQAGDLPPHATLSPTPDDTTSPRVGYYIQSPHSPRNWQSSVEFQVDATLPYYGAHFHDQQYHSMSHMDSTFHQTSSFRYNEDWSTTLNFKRSL